MAISYKPLWHLLVEKEMNKEDLKRAANITSNIVSRMSKNAYVNLDSIEKICLAMDCRIEDVVEIMKDNRDEDIRLKNITLSHKKGRTNTRYPTN